MTFTSSPLSNDKPEIFQEQSYFKNFNYASLLCGSVIKNPPADEGDAGSVLGLGSSPGEKNGFPPQYS